ncbi:MAG: 3-oxoacyl-[acyl-carrier-protein] synthase 3 [Candidatus Poribacteria bacterium]|nr:MAG: 3-oxoacyl-[acyl-carrier-protein] synthase 3 [Candidatus Poribacteria bacterium]
MAEGAQRLAIVGTGSAVPEKVVTNFDLEQIVDTSDEWIRKRTGIVERRVAEADVASSDLGTLAAQRALEAAGLPAEAIDFILCSTVSPDMFFPSTACQIARNLGLEGPAPAMDIQAACSGFSYALHVADGLIRSGLYRRILVIAAETLTRFVDWTDRSTCVLFGDAAGAVVVEPASEGQGLLYSKIGAFPQYAQTDILSVPAGGSRKPFSQEVLENREHYIRMQGREVFKIAVSTMPEITLQAIQEAGLQPEAIDWIIPHQANIRITDAIAQRLGVSMDRVYTNIDRYGNTSSASVAVALDELVRSGQLQRGQTVLLVTFGAGWTWGVNIFRY